MAKNYRSRSPFQEMAADRFRGGLFSFYDMSKQTAQACLLINGGAATAVIAFLAKEHVGATMYRIVPWCLAGYALGVAMSALMLFCSMMSGRRASFLWGNLSFDKARTSSHSKKRATLAIHRWQRGYDCMFAATILLFLFSSFLLAYSL